MIKNLQSIKSSFKFLTIFFSFFFFFSEKTLAFPIYAQQAYENPREANGR